MTGTWESVYPSYTYWSKTLDYVQQPNSSDRCEERYDCDKAPDILRRPGWAYAVCHGKPGAPGSGRHWRQTHPGPLDLLQTVATKGSK